MNKPTVLIADDSRTIRIRVRRILLEAGFHVIEADNGMDAVRQIENHVIDVAIMDIQMPQLDGYGVCQELQARGFSPERLPVLFLTSVESNALEVLGRTMGDYLKKPIDRDELLSSVNRLIGQRQGFSPTPPATSR